MNGGARVLNVSVKSSYLIAAIGIVLTVLVLWIALINFSNRERDRAMLVGASFNGKGETVEWLVS